MKASVRRRSFTLAFANFTEHLKNVSNSRNAAKGMPSISPADRALIVCIGKQARWAELGEVPNLRSTGCFMNIVGPFRPIGSAGGSQIQALKRS